MTAWLPVAIVGLWALGILVVICVCVLAARGDAITIVDDDSSPLRAPERLDMRASGAVAPRGRGARRRARRDGP